MTALRHDVKLLFAKSGGLCAFRGCRRELIVRSTNDIIGHMAHIVARSDAGPRADSFRSASERNTYENLILLCPTHHAEIDTPEGSARWSRDALLAMKAEHEQWVQARLAIGHPAASNVSQLDYLNVPRLAAYALLRGLELEMGYIDGVTLLIDTAMLTAYLMNAFDRTLAQIQLNALPLDSVSLLDPSIVGLTMTFEGICRTKKVPTPDRVRAGKAKLTGCIEHDPHIYLKVGSARLIMAIDPKWILSVTGWGNFKPSGGQFRFAGACTVKHVDTAERRVIASPLFIGSPHSEWDDMF